MSEPREWIQDFCEDHVQSYWNDEPIWKKVGEFINAYDQLLQRNGELVRAFNETEQRSADRAQRIAELEKENERLKHELSLR